MVLLQVCVCGICGAKSRCTCISAQRKLVPGPQLEGGFRLISVKIASLTVTQVVPKRTNLPGMARGGRGGRGAPRGGRGGYGRGGGYDRGYSPRGGYRGGYRGRPRGYAPY